jgi:hypothetical protein
MTIEERIQALEDRNTRVELDKAWETSNQRRFALVVLTYIVMNIFLYSIGIQRPYLNAIIPTLGFFLSTLTLQSFKNHWLRHKK